MTKIDELEKIKTKITESGEDIFLKNDLFNCIVHNIGVMIILNKFNGDIIFINELTKELFCQLYKRGINIRNSHDIVLALGGEDIYKKFKSLCLKLQSGELKEGLIKFSCHAYNDETENRLISVKQTVTIHKGEQLILSIITDITKEQF